MAPEGILFVVKFDCPRTVSALGLVCGIGSQHGNRIAQNAIIPCVGEPKIALTVEGQAGAKRSIR